jgi:uncharacterized protein
MNALLGSIPATQSTGAPSFALFAKGGIAKSHLHSWYRAHPVKVIKLAIGITIVLLSTSSPSLRAQANPDMSPGYQQTYDRMLRQIRLIPIFDDHGHPGFDDDTDVDAMASSPSHSPLRLLSDNPELIEASKDLFSYPYSDNAPEHLKWLITKKAEMRQKYPGYQYFDRILDQLNVETMMANRVAMPAYLDRKRFHWVFFVDSFLFPLDNSELTARNIDEGVYVPLQEKLMKRELAQAGLSTLPGTFPAYLAFVSKIVEQNRAHGGVAIKFEIAYFRTLHFDDPPETAAASIYNRYVSGGKPSTAEHTILEDFMFRYLLREASRLHLAVQIHTAVGTGDFYSVSGGNVLNLENVLRDPRYSNVNFVLLHGGYPFQDQAIWLAARENVYLDSSLMGLYLYPADLAEVLRRWLLLYPDKVVFGSDAFPFNEAIGAEESDWLAIESARKALAAALARMILNGEVSEPRALAFAHGYLHDNAARIYPAPLQ